MKQAIIGEPVILEPRQASVGDHSRSQSGAGPAVECLAIVALGQDRQSRRT
jgi:hypothetical protein